MNCTKKLRAESLICHVFWHCRVQVQVITSP